MKLQGRTVLVTGAAKRLGREISLAFAKRGANIILHCNKSVREASLLRREIESLGVNAWVVRQEFDLGQSKVSGAVRKLGDYLRRECPPVDILVNNASIFYPTPLEKVNEKDWDAFQTVNLKVPFFLAQHFGTLMKKRKSGKIINLLDWTGWRPDPRYLPYAVSKAGLIMLTEGLAKALAPHVQVNGVAPGPILKAKGMTRLGEKTAISKTLLGRFGKPQDIAKAVLFLCESTDFVTGVCLPVDGGCRVA